MQTFRTECRADSPFSPRVPSAIIHTTHVVYCSWENKSVKTSLIAPLYQSRYNVLCVLVRILVLIAYQGLAPSFLIYSCFPQDTNMKLWFGNHHLINISFCITRWHQSEESVARRLENASEGILLILYSSVNTMMAFLISHFDSSKHLKWKKF